MESSSIIPKHGGYRKLKSFQVAELTYDVTVRFCDKYISKRSRTHDQMVQAARSGVQNIAEGSQFSATSQKLEMKLTSAARSSLEELKRDYEDYLRQHRLPIWDQEDPRRKRLISKRPRTADDVARWALREHEAAEKAAAGPNRPSGRSAGSANPSTTSTKSDGKARVPSYSEIAANGALALANVAGFLLDRQLSSLATKFEKEGGFTERLYRVRSEARKNAK